MTSLPAHFAATLPDSTSQAGFVCVGCGSRDSRLVSPPRGWPWPMRQCDACGLIQQSPRRCSRQPVAQPHSFPDADAPSEPASWSSAVQRYVECLLPLESHTGRNLLIVGCGRGHLAALARARGWRVVGLDPSPQAICRAIEQFQLDARAGGLARHREALGRFDVVLCGNLETAWDPAAVLRDARTVLNTAGVVCVDVSDGFADMGARPEAGDAVLNVFDAGSLERLLQACGLGSVAIRASGHANAPQLAGNHRGMFRWIPRFLARWMTRLWHFIAGERAAGSACLRADNLSEAVARVEALASKRASSGGRADRLIAVAARAAAAHAD
ncbi:MAG: class I SAM-dependent methyltransferase [Planctomycetia bacterium]|nr:MAG: class I SAM-dependent methyltransferase [Planctomycetia bacterium]